MDQLYFSCLTKDQSQKVRSVCQTLQSLIFATTEFSLVDLKVSQRRKKERAIFIETPCEFSSLHCLSFVWLARLLRRATNMDKCKTTKKHQTPG
jgi:hypothetical protein